MIRLQALLICFFKRSQEQTSKLFASRLALVAEHSQLAFHIQHSRTAEMLMQTFTLARYHARCVRCLLHPLPLMGSSG